MKVKEFDDYSYHPNRKPWLILVLCALIIVLAVGRRNARVAGPDADEVSEEPGATETVNAAPPDRTPVPRVVSETTGPAERTPPPDRTPAVKLVPVVNPSGGDLVAKARAYEKDGDFLNAREHYHAALGQAKAASAIQTIENLLGSLNVELTMNPYMIPEKISYSVRPGDSVAKIAKKYGTTVDLLVLSNDIKNPNRIKAGDRHRVFSAKFSLLISKSRNDLLVMMNDRFFKRYRVGTGKFGRTPVGSFKIDTKQKKPDWWPSGRRVPYGDKENILGTRWMAIEATGDTPDASGYGIHGTWDNTTIGQSVSRGCVRMRNADVEELYTLLPVGTRITIIE